MKKKLFNALKALTFFGIGFSILYMVYKNQNIAYQEECALKGIPEADCSLIGKVIEDITSANYFWLSVVLGVFIISNISRAQRWVMLLRPMGYRPKIANAFWCTMIGYLTNLGLPRAGEVIKAALLSKYENIPLEKVGGTVFTDRAVDVISLAVVMGLAFLVEYDTIYAMISSNMGGGEEEGTSGGMNILWWLAGIGVLAVGLVIVFFKKLSETRLFKKIKNVAQGFWEGIQTVRDLESPGWFVFHSINIWFMYYLMMFFGVKAYEPLAHLDWGASLVLFVTGGLAFLIPAPGGMGSYHLMITEVCETMYNIDGADGFSFANIIFFLIQIFANIGLGLLAFIVLPIINRKRKTNES